MRWCSRYNDQAAGWMAQGLKPGRARYFLFSKMFRQAPGSR